MSETPTDARQLRPHFEDVQAHYDLSDDFFGLFQDPSRTYSCAYFEPPELTLEEAQIAKIDLNLDKLDLRPGMTLLDIGCGWGATMRRAIEKYDVNVIGLTLSKNQRAYCQQLLDGIDTDRSRQVLLHGWEEFSLPVDRIVSVEAFEHFGHERYDDFFSNCFNILPDDGRMAVQSSVGYHPYDLNARGKKVTFDTVRFIKFIVTEIFPGGRLPSTAMMVERGEKAGFVVPEALSLRPHYIKTLRIWGDTLEANKDKAVAIQSEEVYERYMKYLRGCEHYFTDEILDVSLVTYLKPGATTSAGAAH
ncbi:MAG: cyclopropane mycolic acid synthase family methyltransferase [Mycobacterium sp.]